jgi:hypothetical protein
MQGKMHLLAERHPAQQRPCPLHYQSHLSVRHPLCCVWLGRYPACAAVGGSGTLLLHPFCESSAPSATWVSIASALSTACQKEVDVTRPQHYCYCHCYGHVLLQRSQDVGSRSQLARHLNIGPCIRKPCQITQAD